MRCSVRLVCFVRIGHNQFLPSRHRPAARRAAFNSL
jgi:hypothetical protein